jgi:hypothetical protein
MAVMGTVFYVARVLDGVLSASRGLPSDEDRGDK